MMILFHRTAKRNADAILAGGFKDAEGTYMTGVLTRGVFLSDRPLDANEGADGDVLLEVELAITEEDLSEFEWKEEGKPYREWQVPASLLNSKGRVYVSSIEEDEP